MPVPAKTSASGRIPKWPTGADCKSAGLRLRWFESSSYHHSRTPSETAILTNKIRHCVKIRSLRILRFGAVAVSCRLFQNDARKVIHKAYKVDGKSFEQKAGRSARCSVIGSPFVF